MSSPFRVIGAWILVMAAAAAGLKALDYVPSLLAGVPHRARVFRSVEEAEQALGARLWLPAYFPDELLWPPARIEASATAPPTLVARIAGRDGTTRLLIAESLGGAVAPPGDLVPPGERMETTEVALGRHRGFLVRVLVGTAERHDLWWDQGGRRVTLRYAGPVDQLLLIGGSLERMHQ